MDCRPLIEKIVEKKSADSGRTIVLGPHPQILYYTGKREIVSADTDIGIISASHRPTFTMGGPEGVWLKNTIAISVKFSEEREFHGAIAEVAKLLRFFEVIIGRPQNIVRLHIRLKEESELHRFLKVYWNMLPKHPYSSDDDKPRPQDVLIDGAQHTAEFSSVLTNWLARDLLWSDARERFSYVFETQNTYGPNRLIAAANMFDILPANAVPRDTPLSPQIQAARDSSRSLFAVLPASIERDSILSALGRLGKSSLKHKIRHRAQFVSETVGDRFPDISLVTDEAVNCRNHYVHGSAASYPYNEHFSSLVFLNDTLEFVFAASDLIECGWNIRRWLNQGTTMSHPFGTYRVGYQEGLNRLKARLNKSS